MIVLISEEAQNIFQSYRHSGFTIQIESSLVIVNTTSNLALTLVPAINQENINFSEILGFGANVETWEFLGQAPRVHGSHIVCYQVLWWTVCIDYCYSLAIAVIGACRVGCTAACCFAVPPFCPYCATACSLCGLGFNAVYNWCVDIFH